jgi:hypothetical protein
MGKHRLNGFLVQLSLRHQVGEQARLVERILDRLGHGAAAAFFAAGAAFAGAAGFWPLSSGRPSSLLPWSSCFENVGIWPDRNSLARRPRFVQ